MRDAQLERTLGVVFTDIEGSTTLLRALGNRFDGLLARHHALMREAMSSCGGDEVGTEGDAFFVLFERPADAIAACVEAQRLLAAEPWPDDGVIRVRMGIHCGEVRPGGDNYIGMGVHQGARVVLAAHGGQIIVSAAVAAAVGTALPERVGLVDLGAFHLRDFDGPQHLFQVLHPDLARSFPPPRVASAAVHNLAPARTSFVGRSAELNELVKATDIAPLVSIVGPGGVGKTRLASEVGLYVAGRYPAGVWLVGLASTESSDAVAEQVKVAMALVDQPGRTAIQVIAERLASGAGLIILDNCEHVLDGCVELVESLLAVSETTRVLTTSREHLGMLGEEVIRLGPLDLPDERRGTVGGYGAAELFVARGAQARRGFELTEDNTEAIASICRRLDGIPLALELAAARLSTMSVGQIDQRLDDALGLLESGRRGGEDRQRTLRATLDWSHRLLDADDRAVFSALSVFRGGFDADAAATIVGAGNVEQSLEHLVAQSLVEFDPVAEPPRYRLLETMRAYAAERLHDTDEAPALVARHAEFYAGLARDSAAEGDTVAALDRLGADHPNLLAALEHLAASDRPIEHGQLLVDMSPFWSVRGHWQLSAQQHLGYLARTDCDRALSGQVLGLLGNFTLNLGDAPSARVRLEEAVHIARALGDRHSEGRWVADLGSVASAVGNYSAARASFEEALTIARELGDPQNEGILIGNLGVIAYQLGDYPAARACYEDALRLARELGDRRRVGIWVGSLANAASDQGDYPAARLHLEEALAIARELGDRAGESRCVGNLGAVAAHLGDYRDARFRYEEALGIARDLGDRQWEGFCVGRLGDVAVKRGDYPAARAPYEEALGIARKLGDVRLEGNWIGSLGEVAHNVGDFAAARAGYEEARGIAREIGDRRSEGFWVGFLGDLASDVGNYPKARACYEEALGIARALATNDTAPLEGCGALLARLDRCEDAAQLLGAADNLNARAHKVRPAPVQARHDAARATCRDRLGEAAFAAAWKRGGGLEWDSAADTALELLGRV